ncbi:hypothetical protein [Sphingobacterium hungaricum]|uniref:Uncharacterized protein n=1 Tax=Sphingobacterium hungaricum TaxID=2082723 RepID=A0A928UY08_9SPHI|nr:hypothetical protein [Sphingobacterium hungaricum]MBE8714772.1 hypothetical protein [Sphingobacterium hungaricum]
MVNYLHQTQHPQLNYEAFFEVMRDFRKGGLNPNNYDEFITFVRNLPPIVSRSDTDYGVFKKFNLTDLNEDDFQIVIRELFRRSEENSKRCWHPEAGVQTCKLDKAGNISISAAHSIQNNRVLSQIAKDGHVMTYKKTSPGFDGKLIGKSLASVFWGFCNTHDAIFKPIEVLPYTQTAEQNFLFAYRGFIVAAHKKIEGSYLANFGDQADNDIKETKKIFDKAILKKDYNIIETKIFELPVFYPIAASSSFYLDFDFEGNQIPHSENRMEYLYVSLFPDSNKTYFLISYFKNDVKLYEKVCSQIVNRGKLKSDITILLAGHVGNIYFEPVYYSTFIDNQMALIEKALIDAQFDYGIFNGSNSILETFNLTPNDYLKNPYELNFFGY